MTLAQLSFTAINKITYT